MYIYIVILFKHNFEYGYNRQWYCKYKYEYILYSVYLSSISAKYSSHGYKADKNVLFTWQEFLVKKLINYSSILAAPFNFTSNCVNPCEV